MVYRYPIVVTQPMIRNVNICVHHQIRNSEKEASSKSLVPPPGGPFLNSGYENTMRRTISSKNANL